jgi:hypothetical protein
LVSAQTVVVLVVIVWCGQIQVKLRGYQINWKATAALV